MDVAWPEKAKGYSAKVPGEMAGAFERKSTWRDFTDCDLEAIPPETLGDMHAMTADEHLASDFKALVADVRARLKR